jgi:DNA-binding NarL/FixJ family response regulator
MRNVLATGTVPPRVGKRPFPAYLRPPKDLCLTITPMSLRGATPVAHQSSSTAPKPLPRNSYSVLNSDLSQPLERDASSDDPSIADPRISVIMVAAERLFGLGLASLLSEDDRLNVIEVSDGDPELLDLCISTSVDVVLIDLELTRVDGIDLVRLLSVECPEARTIVLTSNADWRVRPAMIAGASGILLKDSSPEAIRAAVVSVHLGDQVLCTEAAQWFLGEERSTHLTQRESDVLRMVAQGANNAEIATKLQLGQKTVRNYVSRLYRKLDLNNRAQLATFLDHTDATHAGRTDAVATDGESPVNN